MPTLRVEVTKFKCTRCGHEWIPIDENKKPAVCPNPKCKSPYWDRPRRLQNG